MSLGVTSRLLQVFKLLEKAHAVQIDLNPGAWRPRIQGVWAQSLGFRVQVFLV